MRFGVLPICPPPSDCPPRSRLLCNRRLLLGVHRCSCRRAPLPEAREWRWCRRVRKAVAVRSACPVACPRRDSRGQTRPRPALLPPARGGGRRWRCAPRGVGARGAARGKGGAHGSPPRSRSTGWRRRRPGALSQRWVCTCWVVGWAHSEPSQHTFSDHPTGPLGAPEHTLREPETNRFCFDRSGSRLEVPRHANLTVRIVAAVFGRRPSRSHPPMVVTGPAALSLPPSLESFGK